ncbi:type II toxin-antitoxin system RelE/ParE family toxin [Endozoicomonas sp. 4G]|uniref:type II toxin-antitoxin system RelE/ParE family toxin n=1 Tax=Endozoicomonas sp. 4G TaxID=2872754 RepID=UPI0020790BA8|nr:type II toxin-antitoxin system RelE/ParE family toxin [Endozoicomonas sp. 4G]
MAKAKTILQTARFARAVKKLKPNQKADLDTAIMSALPYRDNFSHELPRAVAALQLHLS